MYMFDNDYLECKKELLAEHTTTFWAWHNEEAAREFWERIKQDEELQMMFPGKKLILHPSAQYFCMTPEALQHLKEKMYQDIEKYEEEIRLCKSVIEYIES